MDRRTAHFLHIGKTGGTAVRDALACVAPTHRITLHGHEFRLRDVPQDEQAFFFLRDPTRRFVSAFNSRLRQGRPRHNTLWTREEAWAFSVYPTANDLAEDMNSPSGERAMRGIDHVNTSFADWLESADYLASRDILFIGRQERLDQDFEILKQRLRLDEPQSVQLPTDPIARHSTPSHMHTLLSETAVRNLRTWYQADYRLLNSLVPLETAAP